MRMARKPSAIARELLRNFPKGGKRRRKRSRKRKGEKDGENGEAVVSEAQVDLAGSEDEALSPGDDDEEPAGVVDAGGDS
jgi:hypothetical protein